VSSTVRWTNSQAHVFHVLILRFDKVLYVSTVDSCQVLAVNNNNNV